MGVFRAYDAIQEVTQAPEAKLTMPDLVRTNNMRKYIATMLQVNYTINGLVTECKVRNFQHSLE